MIRTMALALGLLAAVTAWALEPGFPRARALTDRTF
jgi:hypothetical protein